MTVLMFGWEFPPHISGGLGTACLGLTQSLIEENAKILFVVPRAHGDERIELINASEVLVGATKEEVDSVIPPVKSEGQSIKITVASTLAPYTDVEQWQQSSTVEKWNYEFPATTIKEVVTKGGKRYEFTGTYGPALLDEVQRYSEVAAELTKQYTFDVIHAHDWLTYPAGIEAKRSSNKPLIVHVHATEFDRAGEKNIDKRVFDIEYQGMQEADMVIAVSQWTKDIVVSKYRIDAAKVKVVHNGIVPQEETDFSVLPKISEHIVTFLGRITYQKGPQYFIEAARKVLLHFPDAHFIMAGSGDLLPAMMERVAQLRISSHFHFTGFLKEKQIHQVWSVSNVYVMPSVSEPFGITPLEAIQAGVPVIVSNQSGIAEVMDHAIKADFWDTDALANAIIGVLKHKALSKSLKASGKKEIETLTWSQAAKKINDLYHELQSIKQIEAISESVFSGTPTKASSKIPVF
jgi:glycogen(starch) synthase